jgi:NADH-quinone oxidoreductase subunit D
MRKHEDLQRRSIALRHAAIPLPTPDPPPPKDRVYTEMEALIQHFLIYSQGFTVPAGEAHVPVGDRAANRASTWCRMGRMPVASRAGRRPPGVPGARKLIVGGLIADVIAVIGSIDAVMGTPDRELSSEDGA